MTSRRRTSPFTVARDVVGASALNCSKTESYCVCAWPRAGKATARLPITNARRDREGRLMQNLCDGEVPYSDGGHRIRTCKGLRPPVFKTGALAIRPALPTAFVT